MIKIAKYKFFFVLSDLIILFFILIVTSITLDKILNIEIRNANGNIGTLLLTFVLIVTSFLIFSFNNLYKISLILVRSAHTTAVIKSIFYLMLISFPTSLVVMEVDLLKMLIISLSILKILQWNRSQIANWMFCVSPRKVLPTKPLGFNWVSVTVPYRGTSRISSPRCNPPAALRQ